MITASAVYRVLEAIAPLYTAAALGYASVRWLGAFSEERCAGINHFVATYAVLALLFDVVSTNDPYAMNGRLVAADTLQKAATLLGLLAWAALRRGGDKVDALQWVVTAFSVAQLPSTIIMGVPLLGGMYGPVSKGLLKQMVVMQFCVWYNLVIFMYEYMAARRASTSAENGACDDAGIVGVDVEVTDVATSHEGMTTTVSPGGDGKTAPLSVRHIALMAGKKVLKIPNTYASFLGLIWALIAFKCGIKMPKIVVDSMFIIETTTVGLSMFGSGTFIARQSRFVPCGYVIASVSMALKFFIGPMAMLLASLAMGMHGTLLHIAVVQSALPLTVTSFVYAEEYKVHADIMSTGVILGIFISFPVTIVYYVLLE